MTDDRPGAPTARSDRQLSVLALLGTRWETLEHHNTRWAAIIRQWAADDRIGHLTVVGYPTFRPRGLLRGGRWRGRPSWLPGTTTGTVDLLLHRRISTPMDAVAWRWAGHELARGAGGPLDLAIAATPLWAPVLRHTGAVHVGFDGVDDWREYDAVAPILGRVECGYAALESLDSITVNTSALASRLGLQRPPVLIGNGVDVDRFANAADAPTGLPAGPFAVYVGVIQDRVDLDLLCAVASAAPDIPVVVAGPGSENDLSRLRAAGVQVLGAIDHSLVPGLLGRASVGLIPHRVNAFTGSMDPLKLLEYLASGLPVVSTPVAAADAASRVLVAETVAETVDAIRAAVGAGRGPVKPAQRVLDKGWDRIADEMLLAHVPELAAQR